MNAKQTEAATGISRRNLRFYEDQGLIHPTATWATIIGTTRNRTSGT